MKFNHLIFNTLFLFLTVSISAQVAPPTIPPPPAGPTTTLVFDATEFDFGQAVTGEKVWHTFTLTNTGTQPLIISNAKGSCGCTVPQWPKEAIGPGETAEIFVVFDTKNKRGRQTKQITITANTNPPQSILYVKGEVVESEEILDRADEPEFFIEFNAADAEEEAEVSAYPNPTSDVLYLSLKDFAGKPVQIDIFNKLGQQLDFRAIAAVEDDLVQLDVSDYDGGLHTVVVTIEGSKRISKRFLVVR